MSALNRQGDGGQRRSLEERIRGFQSGLPYTVAPYSKRNWGHPLHSLCSYQGKLKPAQAHWLVREFANAGDHILDPLGGVGTIAFEAGMLGYSSSSIDINPFPFCIASAKLNPPALEEALAGVDEFLERVSKIDLCDADFSAAQFGLNAKVVDYFHPATLQQVLQVRSYFLDCENLSQLEMFYKACTLHILHGNRPYALSRRSHPITPFAPKGEFEEKDLAKSLKEKVERSLYALPTDYVRGDSFLSDFRDAQDLLSRPVDLVITSPPFVGMRFDRPNWMRLWFCGWGADDFKTKSLRSLDRQQSKSFDVYAEFFESCASVMSNGGLLLVHLGGSKSYNMVGALRGLADANFQYVGEISEDVTTVERHGVSDKGRTTHNYVLIFKRR